VFVAATLLLNFTDLDACACIIGMVVIFVSKHELSRAPFFNVGNRWAMATASGNSIQCQARPR
jgi:hypothetical protein